MAAEGFVSSIPSVSDNPATDNVASDVQSPSRSELLCFMKQKSKLLTFDHLVKLCADFYRSDEIQQARTLIEQFAPKRLIKRQGSTAHKSTLEDILKLLLDPSVKVPEFYAVDLSRLPPVGADHCDVSAILKELHLLRHEVRMMSQLKDEVDDLKKEVATLRSARTDQATAATNNWPQLSDASAPNLSGDMGQITGASMTGKESFVGMAKKLQQSGGITERKPRKQPVIGKSTKFTSVKSVITKRQVDVFVSRWSPHTTTSEVTACVEDILEGEHMDGMECVQLKSKYEHLYSSFFVSVTVPSTCMSKVIGALMSAESWPSGLLVKRYFRVKNDHE